jgi:acetyltransferase
MARGQQVLGEAVSGDLLGAAHIAAPRSSLVTTVDDAVAAAQKIGYPVVLKLAAAEIAHKSELNGVHLDLRTSGEVVHAFGAIMDGAKNLPAQAQLMGVLVQEMIRPGAELLVSVTQDAQFGTVVTVALGGIFTEVLDDPVIRLGPVTRGDALAMFSELRGNAVLRGFRGRAPLALDEAANVVARLSELGTSLSPWVRSIEINPLLVTEAAAAAGDIVAVLGSPEGTAAP